MGASNREDADDGGTYTLLIDLDVGEPVAVEFGAAGTRELHPGQYAYTGSALGPGGFARIDRHRRIASDDHDVRHWHVDYLLGRPDAGLAGTVRSSGIDAECEIVGAIARSVAAEPVHGIGASDCACPSHLAFAPDGSDLEGAVRRAHDRYRA